MSVFQISIILYSLILLWTISRIFVNVKNPSQTLLWLLVVICIPVVGMLLFLILGRSIKRDAYFSKQKPFYHSLENEVPEELKNHFQHPKHRLIELLNKNKSSAFTPHNLVEIYTDGFKSFDALFKALEQAKYSIHLEF